MNAFFKNRRAVDGAVVAGLGICLLIHSAVQFLNLQSKVAWIMSPYLFPMILAGATILLGLTILVPALIGEKPKADAQQKKSGHVFMVLILLALSVAYDLVMQAAGFIPSTALVLLAMIAFLGERRLKILIPVSVLTPVLLTLIFKVGLGVRLP